MNVRCGIVLLLAGGVSACQESEVGTQPPLGPNDSLVYEITVAPAEMSLVTGQTFQLALRVSAGRYVTERSVVWSSSDTTIATVSTAGVVTAGRVSGRAAIVATSSADRTKQDTSGITVVAAP